MKVATLPLYDSAGHQKGEIEVPASLFSAIPREPGLHQAVVAHLAAKRQGTHNVKTRAEVSGSTRKLWRQKGTGRARAGDRRVPHRRGGGVAAGPRPRSYRQRASRRLKKEALRWALSARAREDAVVLVESFELTEAKTRALRSFLNTIGGAGRLLLVLGRRDEAIWRCGRNLPGLVVMDAGDVNSYHVLSARKVAITTDALSRLEARVP